jgi:hypothetical protein
MTTTKKIARDVAEAEFDRMCALRRVNIDPDDMTADEYESLLEVKNKLVRVIERGDLVITESGDPVFTPPVPGAKPLTFHRPTGATFMCLDGDDGNQTRLIRVITEMTRTAKGEISRLEAPDYVVCSKIANLFMAGR